MYLRLQILSDWTVVISRPKDVSAAHRLLLLSSLIITIIFIVVSRSKTICVEAYLTSVKKENSHNEVQYATHSLWWQILMFDVMSEMEALKKILAHVWIKKMETQWV